jgi:hypothetical protein
MQASFDGDALPLFPLPSSFFSLPLTLPFLSLPLPLLLSLPPRVPASTANPNPTSASCRVTTSLSSILARASASLARLSNCRACISKPGEAAGFKGRGGKGRQFQEESKRDVKETVSSSSSFLSSGERLVSLGLETTSSSSPPPPPPPLLLTPHRDWHCAARHDLGPQVEVEVLDNLLGLRGEAGVDVLPVCGRSVRKGGWAEKRVGNAMQGGERERGGGLTREDGRRVCGSEREEEGFPTLFFSHLQYAMYFLSSWRGTSPSWSAAVIWRRRASLGLHGGGR